MASWLITIRLDVDKDMVKDIASDWEVPARVVRHGYQTCLSAIATETSRLLEKASQAGNRFRIVILMTGGTSVEVTRDGHSMPEIAERIEDGDALFDLEHLVHEIDWEEVADGKEPPISKRECRKTAYRTACAIAEAIPGLSTVPKPGLLPAIWRGTRSACRIAMSAACAGWQRARRLLQK